MPVGSHEKTPPRYAGSKLWPRHTNTPQAAVNVPACESAVVTFALMGKIPLVIGVHPSVKANTIQEYVALVKAMPDA